MDRYTKEVIMQETLKVVRDESVGFQDAQRHADGKTFIGIEMTDLKQNTSYYLHSTDRVGTKQPYHSFRINLN